MKKIFLTLGLLGLLTSCSMEDVCGEVNGFDVDCNTAGWDCVYYIYIDGQKESVTRDTWNTTQYGDYICLEF